MGDCLPPIVRSWAELAAAFSNCVDVPGIYALEERRVRKCSLRLLCCRIRLPAIAFASQYHRPPPVEGTNTYEVDCIVAERRDRQTGEESVRVRWKGYPWSEGTWEPKEALQTSEVYKQWTLEREFVPTMRCPDPTFY